MYMQVDVPMERPPVTNWVLIAFTVVFTIKGWAEDRKVQTQFLNQVDPVDVAELDIDNLDEKLQDERLTEAQREQIVRRAIPDVDPETLRQLKNPRLTDERREEILDKELERLLKQKVPAQTAPAQSAPVVPVNRFALHTSKGDFRLWQLITYQFVHADFWHLLGNMLFLFCFGNAINAKLGHWQFILLYVACGIFAGLGWLVLGRGGALVGASGAIAGINGLFLVLYPLNEIAVWDLAYMHLTGDVLRIPSWVFITFYMVMDLIGTMMWWGGGVAYVCHLAGEILGIGIAMGLVLAGIVTSGRGEKNLLEMWEWVKEPEPEPKRRKRRRRPPPPRPTVDL